MNKVTQFEQAAQQKEAGFVSDFLSFLANNKKWWLLPMVMVFLTIAVLALLSGSAAAPFIYTVF